MTRLSNGKKGFLAILLLVACLSIKAQVMWNLKGGIMQRSYIESNSFMFDDCERDKRLDWMAGLELEIPLNEKLNLETGLRYKNHYSFVYSDQDFYEWNDASSHLELPLRLTYKQPLGEHFSLHAGIGPYASYTLGTNMGGYENDKWSNNLQVGLEPSVAINWACLSLGVSYNLPCFYKGFKDENKPAVMATLGIRFKSKTWKYIGAGLMAVATLGTAVATVWPTDGDYSSYNSAGSYTSSSYNSNSYSSSSSSPSSSSNGNKYNISEQNSYNSEKGVYGNYEFMLSNHFSGNRSATANEVREWQRAMKNLRTKWEAKGKSFPKSTFETKSTSGCASSLHSH